MRVYDYDCPKCGNVEMDMMVKDQEEEVYCKVCETVMNQRFPSCAFTLTPHAIAVHKHKYGNKLPDTYKPTGGANFGKL